MKQVALLVAIIGVASLFSGTARASEEDYLVWKNVQISFGEATDTGKLAIAASSDPNGLTSLEITAFGHTFNLTPEQLATIKQFSLASMKVTREAGYQKTAGTAVHFKFDREFYDPVKKLLLTREQAVLTVTKAGLTISVRPRNS
jgi:hypothetical protein